MPGDGIELRDFVESETALRALASSLADLRPMWPLLVPLFVGWMRSQFETEGDFGGDHWEQLSPAYLAWKSVYYPGKGILVATGDLRKAASLPKREVTPTTLTLIIDDSAYTHGGKSPRSVAGYHQDGTDSMPKRPLIFEHFPAVVEAEVEHAAERYIAETVHRLGLRTGAT